MPKNKLAKFNDMAHFPNVLQCPFHSLPTDNFPLKGLWRNNFFHNNNPLNLELGCGRAEYSVELARLQPNHNFIAIDIKGARMWTGARDALQSNLHNVAFLRTRIEALNHFFAPNEVTEIWLTFPDPQPKKPNKRLTAPRFLQLYRSILQPNGLLHLKTDSDDLITFTADLAPDNGFNILHRADNLYNLPTSLPANHPALTLQTAYELRFLAQGLTIKYLSLRAN